VIYTGDIRLLHKMLNATDQALLSSLSSLGGLPSNGTSNLFCETDDTDITWLYLPGPSTRAHRIIYTGNLSPNNNPAGGRKTCTVEFSGELTRYDMAREIKGLPGNLKVLDMHYEPSSYVIQTRGMRDKINDIRSKLAGHKIFLVGRFAEWEYFNMDKAIESAMRCTQEFLKPTAGNGI
jgi:hypothetical protein